MTTTSTRVVSPAERYARLIRSLKPGVRFVFTASGEEPRTVSGVHYVPSGDLPALQAAVPPATLVPDVQQKDQGVGDLLAGSSVGRGLRFIHPYWHRYDAGAYRQQAQGAGLAALCTILSGAAQAAHYLDATPPKEKRGQSERQAALSSIMQYRHQGRANGALAFAKRHLEVLPDQVDDHPGELNTPQGIVDLGSGKVRPHEPARLITRISEGRWEPGATHPLLDEFLRTALPDEAERRMVQQFAGTCLIGDHRRPKKLLVLVGDKDTGKTTLADALAVALGTGEEGYAKAGDLDSVRTTKFARGHNDMLAKAKGARFLVFSEMSAKDELDAATLKRMTGHDTITARSPHAKYSVSYQAQFQCVLATNEMPRLPAEDSALWQRLLVVELRREGPPRPEFEDVLLNDPDAHAAVLAWAYSGLKDYLAHGLAVPDSVRERTAAKRDEASETLSDWLEACTVVDEQALTPSSDLWRSFDIYQDAQRVGSADRISQTKFGRELTERGFPNVRLRQDGRLLRVRRGLRLVPPGDPGL